MISSHFFGSNGVGGNSKAIAKGSESLVVAGMAIGTVFTLFVVPVLYTGVARDRHASAGREAMA